MSITNKILSAIEAIQVDIDYLKQNSATKSELAAVQSDTQYIKQNMVTKDDLTLNNQTIETFFKVELADTNNALKLGLQTTTRRLKEHDKRFEALEDITETDKPHKN